METKNNSQVIENINKENNNNKTEKKMSTFSFALTKESAVKEYDNVGAYNTVQEMMNRKEQLTVKFYANKNNTTCAWIESAHVAGFCYQLKSESFNGLMNYLFNGEVTDFDSNPKETDTLEENTDFQFEVMKMLIEAGKTIQYVPLFRERLENLSAILPCFKGKVLFKIKRTEEALSYLRENKQAV